MFKQFFLFCAFSLTSSSLVAHSQANGHHPSEPLTIRVFTLNLDIESQGVGEQIGTVKFSDSAEGLVIETALSGLTPGEHGFHVHENPSCTFQQVDDHFVPGLSAGGHFDPEQTGEHLGPNADGHLGDLPKLTVDDAGNSQQKLIAKRLTLSLIQGRSIIIHESGDNYSDTPQKLGGGGARVACGVIE